MPHSLVKASSANIFVFCDVAANNTSEDTQMTIVEDLIV